MQEWLIINEARAQDAGTYVCIAENAHAKLDIPVILVVTGVVPYFAQAPVSYMVLPTLPDAYLNFDIEVSFKPESLDGTSDFIYSSWKFLKANRQITSILKS